MSIFKNRSAIQVGRDLTAFLNLELGTVRNSYVPDYERLFEKQRIAMDQKLSRVREQLDERDRQLSLSSGQLVEKDGLVDGKERQLTEAREQLAENSRELSRLRQRLAEQDRRLVDYRARTALELKDEEYDSYDRKLYFGLNRLLDRMPADLGGGCSLSKAYMMASLIRRHEMKSTVDIGVYRGRSLFPQALAHREYTGGLVYGVDPWSLSEAREEDLSFTDVEREEEIARFVRDTDWEYLYRGVERSRNELGYGEYSELLRRTSAEAAACFEEGGVSFDLVHIDGNHDTVKVMQDVELYLPLLRKGGYIVLDDVSFESIKPAHDELSSRMRLMFQRTDQDGENDYAVFRDVGPPLEATHNWRFWAQDFW